MNLDDIKTILKKLTDNKIEYKLNGHIFAAKYVLRQIFFENCNDENKIKDAIGKDNLKRTKFLKTLEWYLGDRQKKLSLLFKVPPKIEIEDWERIQTDDYSDGS